MRKQALNSANSVHPRVCGERALAPQAPYFCAGSSPRVRGTLHPPAARRADQRFIPACAGNARSGARSSLRLTVHPRVCGERSVKVSTELGDNGSSPRVRGTREFSIIRRSLDRFIPACAGNAHFLLYPTAPQSVHPRVCGERYNHPLPAGLTSGSSPRVRGTPRCRNSCPPARRFIPACAGNAMARDMMRIPPAVHPRVCGERTKAEIKVATAAGSSPRVRGTRDGFQTFLGVCRFIPACAGNAPALLPKAT